MSKNIAGLQTARVIQLQNDPSGQFRILVSLVTGNTAENVWARVAAPDAGNNRGSFFMPEIGDEVIVGFINEDARQPVVLGMLHSSSKPPPVKMQDTNNEKGFTTRSRMHISFNDKTKTISIDTPAGNKILLDETLQHVEIRDQNNNSIIMSTNGIQLSSSGNIGIKAGTNLSFSAGAALTLNGAVIAAKADAGMQLNAATVTIASQGLAEIKGLPVKIN